MAVVNYESQYGSLPPAYVLGPDGRPWHSWRVLILEFFNSDLYEEYRFSEPWDGPNNRKLAERMPSLYKFSYYTVPGILMQSLAQRERKWSNFYSLFPPRSDPTAA